MERLIRELNKAKKEAETLYFVRLNKDEKTQHLRFIDDEGEMLATFAQRQRSKSINN